MNFTVRVHSWILPVDHELYLIYNSSFLNVTFSSFVERLSQFTLCQGIILPDSRKDINFVKHMLPKKLNYFDYINTDVKQQVHQDEYFRPKSWALLLYSYNLCKSCREKNIKFNKEINNKKSALTAPARLNAPIKFTSPDRIKLTLQHKRLECKQLEEQISNMKKALDNDSHIVSPELSTYFQKFIFPVQ